MSLEGFLMHTDYLDVSIMGTWRVYIIYMLRGVGSVKDLAWPEPHPSTAMRAMRMHKPHPPNYKSHLAQRPV